MPAIYKNLTPEEQQQINRAYAYFEQLFEHLEGGKFFALRYVLEYSKLRGGLESDTIDEETAAILSNYLKNVERQVFLFIADALSNMSQAERENYLQGANGIKLLTEMDLNTLLTGAGLPKIKDVYHALKGQGSNNNEDGGILDQIGAAEKLADKLSNIDGPLGIVFYSTATLEIGNGEKLPKAYIRNLAAQITQDIVEEINNYYEDRSINPVGSGKRIAEKWFPGKTNILNLFNATNLYSVIQTNKLAYGSIDEGGNFGYLKCNEGEISNLFLGIAYASMILGSDREYQVTVNGEPHIKKYHPIIQYMESLGGYTGQTEYFDDIGREVLNRTVLDTEC